MKRWTSATIPAVLLSTLALGACDSIGEGNGLLRLEISPQRSAGSEELGTFRSLAYQCLPQTPTVFGTFTNGTSAGFNNRATWTSSDESEVEVSNGDIPRVDGVAGNYGFGTLLPRAPGTATVTASFVGLSASIPVEVRAFQSIELTTGDRRLAPGTQQGFELNITTDTFTQVLADSVAWAFVTPDDDTATVNAAGIVTAVAAGDPLELRATLPLCADDLGAAASDSVQVDVEAPVALILAGEFTGTNDLVVATSERYTAMVDFGAGPEQDVTGQVSFMTDDNAIALASPAPNGLLVALTTGTVNLTARLGEEDAADALLSDPLTVNIVDPALESFAVTPATASIPSIGSQQFVATGSYAGGLIQPITRHVAWSVDDTVSASISNAANTAGQASSNLLEGEEQTVTVSATAQIDGAAVIETATLSIQPVACSNGLDDDGDGLIDFEDEAIRDPGCSGRFDQDETDPLP